jgi:transposase-like protein
MPLGIHTDPAIKAELITMIRDNGMTVTEASIKYNVNSKTIYRWLKENVVDGNRNLILENNKLKKELEIAYRILGRFTAEIQKSKE